MMDNQILIVLLPLVGVIIGSLITFSGILLSKRQERKSQIYKLLIEKRIEAYEKILTITKSFQLGIFKIENDEKISCPMVMAKGAKDFTSLFLHFIEATRHHNHLVDIDLRRKTMNFYNYLVNLDQHLKQFKTEDGEWKDDKIVEQLGYMLSDDFVKLTSEIEVEISKFFSSKIYDSKFKPSTLHIDLNKKETNFPPGFLELILFKKEGEIEKLLSEPIQIKEDDIKTLELKE